jgi:phosphatidylglycerophosphate synthase
MQGRLANPLVQRHADRLVALHDWPVEESAAETVGNSLGTNWQIAADMVVLPSTLLATSGMAEEVREREAEAQSQPQQRSLRISRTGGRSNGRSLERESAPLPAGRLLRSVSSMVSPIRALLDQAASDGRVRVLMASAGTPHWYQDVHGPADPKVAERTLLRSLKGELEGFVDRHFNRRFSGTLTPLFLRLGLSANAVTGISMAFGLAAAASIAAGNYAAGIIGALLFQFSAIVDCCDGEVARLTFTESSFGERLDILGDNIVHAAIFAGIAWSVYQQWTPGDGQWIPLALGSAALIANGLCLWLVLRAKKLRSQQNWTSPKQASRSNFILKNVASRDFSVVLLAFALMNHLDWFLWLLAIGTNVFWIVMVWLTRPSLSARG